MRYFKMFSVALAMKTTQGFVQPMISTTTSTTSGTKKQSSSFMPKFIRSSLVNSQLEKMDIAPRWSDFESGLHSSKSSSDNQEDDDKERTGMEEAFESLNELKSLDGNVGTTPIQSSETFTSMDSEIRYDLTQDEINLYKDMYEELESGSGNEIYGDILGELTDNSSKTSFKSDTSSSVVPLDDIDGIGSIQKSSKDDDDDDDDDDSSSSVIDQLNVEELSQDTDKFMRKALEEALDEAKIQGGEGSINNVVDESILNDEEFIKELNAVFDRANEKLLESIASIKKEQDQLSKASAQSRSRVLEEDEARLREAEGSVVRLVEKVKQETLEVERAVKELEEAQQQMGGDPLMKAADLKKAGIVKQGALVGAILFSFRSVGELFLVAQQQGDVEGHSAAAAIQALIALACGGYLLFF